MNKRLPQRRSVRLPQFDYGASGSYFITVCVHERKHVLGFIKNGIMCLSNIGAIIWEEWEQTFRMRPDFSSGAFIVMPNHWHAIVNINRTVHTAPVNLIESFGGSKSDSLATMMRGMQAAMTSRARKECGYSGQLWQRNFYEHVIRNEQDYNRIYRYIINNTKKWGRDCFYRDEL